MTEPSGDTDLAPDWAGWLRRWDVQQAGYIPEREERFGVLLDTVQTLLGDGELRIVDLACGPGSLTQRAHARFPDARITAVDLDPVLLELARRAVADGDGRITWVEVDLRDPDWPRRLGVARVDAVVSTTALHWLAAPELIQVYRGVFDLLRPGGLFLNGDHIYYSPVRQPTLARLADARKAARQSVAFGDGGVEDYAAWHAAFEAATPELPWAERRRRFGERIARRPGYDLHTSALRDAGFAEVDTIWQIWDNRVILAVRGDDVAPDRFA